MEQREVLVEANRSTLQVHPVAWAEKPQAVAYQGKDHLIGKLAFVGVFEAGAFIALVVNKVHIDPALYWLAALMLLAAVWKGHFAKLASVAGVEITIDSQGLTQTRNGNREWVMPWNAFERRLLRRARSICFWNRASASS